MRCTSLDFSRRATFVAERGFLALLIAAVSAMASAAAASAAAPTVPATFTTAVTTKTAILKAEVNPNGEATSYHFEYGTADCGSSPCSSIPVPDAGIGSGASPVVVAREITGLAPDAQHHFRVVATNGSGTIEGPDTVFHTYAPPASDADCANREFRVGAAANMPDCRAYEMVSPADKGNGEILVPFNGGEDTNIIAQWVQSSQDGNKLTYSAPTAYGDSLSSKWVNQFVATRGAAGWSSHSINAPQGDTFTEPDFTLFDLRNPWRGFSADLSTGWMMDYSVTPLAPGGRPDSKNLYKRNLLSGGYETLSQDTQLVGPTSGFESYEAAPAGFSEDGEHTILSADTALTPDAHTVPDNAEGFTPGTLPQLYDYSDGQLDLVSVLPNGEAATGWNAVGAGRIGLQNRRNAALDNAVSADGSRIFWTNHEGFSFDRAGVLFLRLDGETTIPVSESVTTDPVLFWTASNDGSAVIFSAADLLYKFDVATETPTLIAEGVTGVAGAADDLSHVYFVSEDDLDSGAVAGQPNLYLDREGSISLIATLGAGDVGGQFTNESSLPINHVARVTPDGGALVFTSRESLTGYDNTDVLTGGAAVEVFVFDADADELVCASCNPSGARPVGGIRDTPFQRSQPIKGTPVAAWIPTWEWSLNELHPLSADGNRLFFNAFDSLDPRDTNGVQDVYQWQAQGSGSCERPGGCVGLISSGQSPIKSEFLEGSPDGKNVFFTTASSFVPEDPGLLDIYSARIDGGYPRVVQGIPCEGDACQSVPPAPNDSTPASASFRGAGNLRSSTVRDCARQIRRVKKLRRRASRVRRSANRLRTSPRTAKQRRMQAARIARRAKRLNRSAKRCRRAGRRAVR